MDNHKKDTKETQYISFNFRLSKEEKEILKRAAPLERRSTSSFVKNAALDRAIQLLHKK